MQTKKCPFCAEDIVNEAVYCKHCKSDLSAKAQPAKKKTGLNCVGAAVFFGALFFILMLGAAATMDTTSLSTETDTAFHEPNICDINSYVAGAVIQGYAKYPDEAKQSCTYASMKDLGNHEYEINGYVKAKNAFGVEGRIYYTVVMRYKGGTTNDFDNWELVSGPEITTE